MSVQWQSHPARDRTDDAVGTEQSVAKRLDDIQAELAALLADMARQTRCWAVQRGQLDAAIGGLRDRLHGLPPLTEAADQLGPREQCHGRD